MPSLLRSACHPGESESHCEDEESSDYAGHVLALNGHKKYFCLFRPVFTGDDHSDSSSETSASSDSKRKSRPRSRTSSHSRSRSHSREDGAAPRRGSSRATSIEVHHKLDRLGVWMERLMEGTLPRLHVPAWPPLSEDSPSTESWGQSKDCWGFASLLGSCRAMLLFSEYFYKFCFAYVGWHWTVGTDGSSKQQHLAEECLGSRIANDHIAVSHPNTVWLSQSTDVRWS